MPCSANVVERCIMFLQSGQFPKYYSSELAKIYSLTDSKMLQLSCTMGDLGNYQLYKDVVNFTMIRCNNCGSKNIVLSQNSKHKIEHTLGDNSFMDYDEKPPAE